MNRQRLQFVTAAFLLEMRRQAAKTGKQVEIKALDDYPPEQRSALMSALEKAVKAADPAADATFETWAKNRAQKEPSNT